MKLANTCPYLTPLNTNLNTSLSLQELWAAQSFPQQVPAHKNLQGRFSNRYLLWRQHGVLVLVTCLPQVLLDEGAEAQVGVAAQALCSTDKATGNPASLNLFSVTLYKSNGYCNELISNRSIILLFLIYFLIYSQLGAILCYMVLAGILRLYSQTVM